MDDKPYCGSFGLVGKLNSLNRSLLYSGQCTW